MRTVVPVQWLSLCLLCMLSAFAIVCVAAPEDEREPERQIVLQGILGSKALLLVDGKRLMLSAGQAKKWGVSVLRIASDHVEVNVDGQSRRLRLGDSYAVTTPFKARKSVEVVIPRNKRGMYSTIGSINGLPVTFLVDTGASTIAMNAQQATRLAIDFRVIGKPTFVSTASGVTRAYRVTLDQVSVGEIKIRNIVAVVMDGQFPVQVLLGMSFLGQLEIQREAGLLHLKKNF